MLNIATTMIMEKALTRVRELSRARFTQSPISKAAAKSSVPVIPEFGAPSEREIMPSDPDTLGSNDCSL